MPLPTRLAASRGWILLTGDGELRAQPGSGNELVPVRARDLYRVVYGYLFLISGRSGHPRVGFFPTVDAEFERAAASNAAEEFRKLLVVLEFKPVNKAVSIAVRMNDIQQLLAIELTKLFWRKAASKRRVVFR